MDLIVDVVDPLCMNAAFSALSSVSPAALQPHLEPDASLRLVLVSWLVWTVGGWIFYLGTAGLAYALWFDKSLMNHKKFLPNQIRQEITLAMWSIPVMAVPTALIFLAEMRGYSQLFHGDDWTWSGAIISALLMLVATDCGIYWIHRWEHTFPWVYKHIHKPHHKWVVSTPFASHAFHPMDGFAQSLPYHVFVFVWPMHKVEYLFLFMLVNAWTVSIHDQVQVYYGEILNGADHHTIHHREFNYNYGQYLTFWDRVGGTHKPIGLHHAERKAAKKARAVAGSDDCSKKHGDDLAVPLSPRGSPRSRSRAYNRVVDLNREAKEFLAAPSPSRL